MEEVAAAFLAFVFDSVRGHGCAKEGLREGEWDVFFYAAFE
jgi:hypothetical protein